MSTLADEKEKEEKEEEKSNQFNKQENLGVNLYGLRAGLISNIEKCLKKRSNGTLARFMDNDIYSLKPRSNAGCSCV